MKKKLLTVLFFVSFSTLSFADCRTNPHKPECKKPSEAYCQTNPYAPECGGSEAQCSINPYTPECSSGH